jgi:hypothetical protein
MLKLVRINCVWRVRGLPGCSMSYNNVEKCCCVMLCICPQCKKQLGISTSYHAWWWSGTLQWSETIIVSVTSASKSKHVFCPALFKPHQSSPAGSLQACSAAELHLRPLSSVPGRTQWYVSLASAELVGMPCVTWLPHMAAAPILLHWS